MKFGAAMAVTVTVGVLLVATDLRVVPTSSGEPRVVVSATGGFRVKVPVGWHVQTATPGPGDSTYLEAREPGILGRFPRGGFWVERWHRRGDDLSSLTAALEAERTSPQEPPIERTAVAGHQGVRWTRERRTFAVVPRFVPGATTRITDHRFIDGEHVYNVGFWAVGGATFEREFDEVLRSVETLEPRPFTIRRADRGFTLRLPGGWVEVESPVRGAVLHVVSPGDPDAWAYVFRDSAPPATARASAERNIRGNGGHNFVRSAATLGGVEALRLDFRFPDEGRPEDAYDTEWFVADGRGGTLVLAVGRHDPSSTAHERLAAGFALIDRT